MVVSADPGHLQILELRVVPSRIEVDGWAEDEPALAISSPRSRRSQAGSEFEIPAGGGQWIGAVGPFDATAIVRTYLGDSG